MSAPAAAGAPTLGDVGLALPVGRLPHLVHVRDLESFEGPILAQLARADGGATYVEKWCAFAQDGRSRSLLVRSDTRAISRYLAGQTTMLELLTLPNDGTGFIVDRGPSGAAAAQLVHVLDLPSSYLPSPLARHDISLRPLRPSPR